MNNDEIMIFLRHVEGLHAWQKKIKLYDTLAKGHHISHGPPTNA